VQGGCFTVDDRVSELIATPIDAIRLGADALAVAIPVRGKTEGKYLKWLTDSVREANEYNIPIVAHIYPRDYSKIKMVKLFSHQMRLLGRLDAVLKLELM
jgi:fructose-bisphosphate aldolase, class I